ncbi:M23 family metallopeptidase [Sorangium cellulosum]|uniref:M23 family metallopeptidase n=1 Tax=Sorangium cellulosum TaxID=56 RepID=UPI001F31DC8B|nr:M23 family metallopeptidase [Sorangium cellulosum]
MPSAVPQNPVEASGAPDAADRSAERNVAGGSAAERGAAGAQDAGPNAAGAPPAGRDAADAQDTGRDAAGAPPAGRDVADAPPAASAASLAIERSSAIDDALDAPSRPATPPLPSPRRESAPAAPWSRSGDPRARSAPTWAQQTPSPSRTRSSAPWLRGGDPRAQPPRTPSLVDGPYAGSSDGPRSGDGPRLPPGLGRPPPGPHLSPRMTAVFGGIFGLATLTSLIALLIQGVPVRDERALVEAGAAGSAAATEEAAKPAAAPEISKKKRTPLPGPWRISELAKDPSMLLVSDVMERRSFITALDEKGVPKAQIYRVMKAFEGLRKFDKCGRKDRFTVAMERSTRRVRAFEYEVSASEIYQAREDAAGLLAGTTLDMKIAEEEVVGAFYVGKDLASSYQASGLEAGLLDTIDDALSGRLSTESFEEGSTVRLIAVEETALGMFSRYKRIIALEYRPVDPAQKPLRIYHFTGQESRGYFDERGRQPYAGGWRSPIPGAPVTSKFNPKRMHPVLKKTMPHNGTDFGAPTGTPVYSAYRGVVEWVGPAGPSGNLVTVTHPNGVITGYAHLSRYAPGIKAGMKVGTHQLVGYVGSTGRSTGPHLHFSAKRDGKYFDAETLQLDGERVMPGIDRAAFAAAKEALDKRIDAIPLPEPPPEPVKPDIAAPSEAPPPAAAGSDAPATAAPEVGPSGPTEPERQPPEGAGDDEGELIEGADLKNPPETM